MALGVENSFIIDSDYVIRDINFTNDEFDADYLFDNSIVGVNCFELFFGLDKPCKNCPVPIALRSNMSAESNIEFIPPNSPRQTRKAKAIPLNNDSNNQVVVDCLAKGVLATIGKPTQVNNIPEAPVPTNKVSKTPGINEQQLNTGKLIEHIAHKVNNNLTVILAQIQNRLYAHEGPAQSGGGPEPSQVIYTEVSKILDFFEKIQVPQPFEKSDLVLSDLGGLVKDSINLVKIQFPNKNVSVQVNVQNSAPLYTCHEIYIMQAIQHLLKNSFEAIENNGIVGVRLTFDEKTKRFSLLIKDNGTGISKENMGYIFDIFFTTKKQTGAFGIGLYFVKTIITNHGGTIYIDSVEKKGTTVKLILPLDI